MRSETLTGERSRCIPTLVAFVEVHSGDPDGTLLFELSDFRKAFASSEHGPARKLRLEFIGKLASINFGPGENYPHTVSARAEANLISPVNTVHGHRRRVQFTEEPADLTVGVQGVQGCSERGKAEEFMESARRLCSTVDMDSSIETKLAGRLDARLVLCVLKNLNEVEECTFKSIAEVGQVCSDWSPLHRTTTCEGARVCNVCTLKPGLHAEARLGNECALKRALGLLR